MKVFAWANKSRLIYIVANVLNSARFDSISISIWLNFRKIWSLLLIGLLRASNAHKMASEAQKPLAKWNFFLVCVLLATVSLKPCEQFGKLTFIVFAVQRNIWKLIKGHVAHSKQFFLEPATQRLLCCKLQEKIHV